MILVPLAVINYFQVTLLKWSISLAFKGDCLEKWITLLSIFLEAVLNLGKGLIKSNQLQP
jgi:hypothetical protein